MGKTIKKHKAIFTEVKKDLYFETWLKYYSKFFTDIYVIDTEPEVPDDILEQAQSKFNFIVIKDYSNPSWNMTIDYINMKHFQRLLLEKYEWVLFTHADEFIIPDPKKYKDLSDYIDKCQKNYVYCRGYNVVQMYQEKYSKDVKEEDKEIDELMLDLSKPILQQRKYWIYDKSYSKPLLSKIPLDWVEGFHNLEGVRNDIYDTLEDQDLILCHLKVADYSIFERRISGRPSKPAGEYQPKDYESFYKYHEFKEIIPERFKEVF